VDVYEIPSKRSKLSLAWTGAASLIEPLPFSSRVYRSRAALEKLKALAAGQPMDVLHVENTLLGDHVTGLPAGARVLMHHNVESDLFRQRAASDHLLPRKLFTRLEAAKMRRFEQRMGPRFGAHIVCSTGDAARLSAILDGARVCVVPNGVDLEYFSLRESSKQKAMNAVHVGGLNWAPNLHGARWLVEEVWPRVRSSVNDATLAFVGRTGEAPVSRWQSQAGVRCLGEVDDVRPFYAGASLSVVPVHVGGGTRLKILNSWAMGTPVVSTTKGCEGLSARPDENLLVADTPEAFAAAVIRLLREPGLGAALGAAGRKLVEAEYGWPRIVEQTERAHQQARDDSTAARSC
jgi:glycosyltransferase involved in cell wall biosynthesis